MVVVTNSSNNTTKILLNADNDLHTAAPSPFTTTPPPRSRSSSIVAVGGGGNAGNGDGGGGNSSQDASSMMDSASRVGLDYIVENPDYVQKLASALESKNLGVKKQVFELLSALSVYSSEGYARTLQALDAFKAQIGERYRFKFLVAELQAESTSSSIEYKTSILAFINCLILASPDSAERIRTRCEFIGLKLITVLNQLRYKHKNHAGLIIQLDVFDEQKESDESQQANSPFARGIDLSSPLEVFDAILRQIADSPQEVPFLCILQHLLSIDSKEPISDLIWDAAERLVHRATLLESRDDALRLLKAPSHAKSLHKLKGTASSNNVESKCTCSCETHKFSSVTSSIGGPPPPPPPVPVVAGGGPSPPPPPPPAPPSNATAPRAPPQPPPPINNGNFSPSSAAQQPSKPLPKLPQQSLAPTPKAKMKTINWNKIPTGQIYNSNNGQNLWTTFSKKQAAVNLDWNELEGLFCLQNDTANSINNANGFKNSFAPSAGKAGNNLPSNNGMNNGDYCAGGAGSGTNKNIGGHEFPARNFQNLHNNNNNGGGGGAAPAKRETSELSLLDAKRSLNINIFLKQFRSSNQEIITLILNGSSSDFGSEKLRGLLKLLPSSDEVEMLQLVSKTDQLRLGSAEKFLLELITINNYRLRVEAMLLREELEICLVNIESSINAILTAADDIKHSEHFQQVIFMIIVAGNFLNSGGYAGDAGGVKLSSLQKIGDIRGNKPGISLLHFIVMQAEARDPKLVSFVNEMPALEDASKTSIEGLKNEINSLASKVINMTTQMASTTSAIPKDIISQYGAFFKEAHHKILSIQSYFGQVDYTRTDMAQFFCEELSSFKLEDCFKIIYTFINKWRDAASENVKRRKQEQEAEARKKAREEQFKKRAQLGLPVNNNNSMQASNEDMRMEKNLKGMTLNPDDELFIACSPRIVRRRLGSLSGHDNMSSGSTQGSNDQLALPSPDITPNGSLRKRRSRLSSDEDESNLMDFLRSSGASAVGSGGNNTPTSGIGPPGANNNGIGSPSMPRKLPGSIIDNQYGSLDRSWSRGTRRRPNLMDFVNSDRERPISPAVPKNDGSRGGIGGNSGSNGGGAGGTGKGDSTSGEHKHESPAREWRERITAWFVDLENGGGGDKPPKRRPPPRRFQNRLGDSIRCDTNGGLATLPEVETNPDDTPVVAPPPLINSNEPTTSTPQFSRTPNSVAPKSTSTYTQSSIGSRRELTRAAAPSTSTYERVYPDRKPSLKVNTDVVSAMEAIEAEAQSPIKEKSLWRTSSISSTQGSDISSTTKSPKIIDELPSAKGNCGGSSSSSMSNGRRNLIGSLGRASANEDKFTLYIPESSVGKKSTAPLSASSSRSPEILEADFGTKEGFDRFASIRRSRRIKKGPETDLPTSKPTSFGKAPPGPDTPIPSRRFISKVDIAHNNEHAGSGDSSKTGFNRYGIRDNQNSYEDSSAPSSLVRSNRMGAAGGSGTLTRTTRQQPVQRSNARSTSSIDPRQVDIALTNAVNHNRSNSTINQNSNYIPIPSSTTTGKSTTSKNSTSLSSSPGTTTTTENDEGFEESPNSLEAATDIVLINNKHKPIDSKLIRTSSSFRDAHNIHNSVGGDGGGGGGEVDAAAASTKANSNNSNSKTLFTMPLIRRKSRTETNAGEVRKPFNTNINSNGSSLLSSAGAGAGAGLTTQPRTINGVNKINGTAAMNGGSTRNSAAPPPPSEISESKSTRSRTPRILSFMRPTASSSAKDKLEAAAAKAAAANGKITSNGIQVNKRAFK